MTKFNTVKFKNPRLADQIEKDLEETWAAFKEMNKGRFKNETAEFRRDMRERFKARFAELYNELADRELYERKR